LLAHAELVAEQIDRLLADHRAIDVKADSIGVKQRSLGVLDSHAARRGREHTTLFVFIMKLRCLNDIRLGKQLHHRCR